VIQQQGISFTLCVRRGSKKLEPWAVCQRLCSGSSSTHCKGLLARKCDDGPAALTPQDADWLPAKDGPHPHQGLEREFRKLNDGEHQAVISSWRVRRR
jgi:hypothetical protein